MALKGASCSIWDCSKAATPLGFGSLQRVDSRLCVNLGYDLEKCRGWGRCCLCVKALEAVAPAEDERPNVSEAESSGADNRLQQNESEEFNRNAFLLPKPLTAFELSSPSDGSKMRVAYQGVSGAYSEDAALKAYPKCDTVPCDEFEAAFKAVELWLVDKAAVPIESSVAGSIHRNYDLLLRHKLHIVGEVKLQVDYCLLGLAGAKREDLKCVVSHPQALAQCEMMLSSLGVVKIGTNDTAAAAKAVASNGVSDTGAIASSRAGKLYGLDILAERIQDNDHNITRFVIISREPIIPGRGRQYKTSIVFSLEEGSGFLFKALGVFALRNINLSKIESRPLKECPSAGVVDDSNGGSAKCFDYIFYIDFEASMAEPRAQYAMENLQEFTRFLRVLGCYPVDRSV